MTFAGHFWTDEMRLKRHGLPIERFYRAIEFDPFGGCWLWAGTLLKSTGYGQLQIDGRSVGAHRFSYRIHKGDIPDGHCICHRCDVRACVNPYHLFVGTQRDNVLDMLAKGRGRARHGSAAANALLTEADIPTIRRLIANGEANRRIAERFNVSPDVINAIRRGRSWKHVPEASA